MQTETTTDKAVTTEIVTEISGSEAVLKALIAERNLKQKDLVPIFKTESIVSDVLNEKRQLTVRHIQELAETFNLSPAVFFPAKDTPYLVLA
jgi:HTH-type transcriptional regulator/antitoxin HigA